jgi:hypothetical protein
MRVHFEEDLVDDYLFLDFCTDFCRNGAQNCNEVIFLVIDVSRNGPNEL